MATPGTGPGCYLLRLTKNGPVHYVGRSDTNLKDRLDAEEFECTSCGKGVKQRRWWNLGTKKQAFEKECEEYHKHSNLCNDIHPAAPRGMKLTCPECEP